MKVKIFFVLFLVAIIFTRFFNLEKTTRFTRDESSNLVDMHRIFVEKKITLVGPIDVSNTIVYPSLTFYMLLPFAALGNFEPASPAYGTAFFGVLTAILLIVLVRKLNKALIGLFSLFVIVWFPLLEASRWAWNPHLVPFWSTLAIISFLRKEKWAKFLSGIFFGLSFHLHYVTFISSAAFLMCVLIVSLAKRNWKEPLLLFLGFLIMVIPFIIFDLRHPPGLFFGKFLTNNLVVSGAAVRLAHFFETFPQNIGNSLFYLSQNLFLAWLLGGVLLVLAMSDIVKMRRSLIFFIPSVAQIAMISFLPNFENRYVFLGIVFFVVWLIEKREVWEEQLVRLAILIMIVGSLLRLSDVLTKPVREPDAYSIRKVSDFIVGDIKQKGMKNVNVAALASPDQDPFGIIYRHVLEIKGIKLLLPNQYDITDNLFVVTTSDADKVRRDESNLIAGFRKGPLVESYQVDTTAWRVYLFNKK